METVLKVEFIITNMLLLDEGCDCDVRTRKSSQCGKCVLAAYSGRAYEVDKH